MSLAYLDHSLFGLVDMHIKSDFPPLWHACRKKGITGQLHLTGEETPKECNNVP